MKEITSNGTWRARRVPSEVMRRFMAYRWPGNVRELRNVLESMVVLAESESLTEADVPETIMRSVSDLPGITTRFPVGLTMEELEKLAIVKALDQARESDARGGEVGDIGSNAARKLRLYDVNKAATTSTGETLT